MSEQPKRIQRKRTKGWKMPDNTVSVCRPGRWGNPFAGERRACVAAFRDLMKGHVEISVGPSEAITHIAPSSAWMLEPYAEVPRMAKQELRGKNLACFCPLDQPCHADFLLEIANG